MVSIKTFLLLFFRNDPSYSNCESPGNFLGQQCFCGSRFLWLENNGKYQASHSDVHIFRSYISQHWNALRDIYLYMQLRSCNSTIGEGSNNLLMRRNWKHVFWLFFIWSIPPPSVLDPLVQGVPEKLELGKEAVKQVIIPSNILFLHFRS